MKQSGLNRWKKEEGKEKEKDHLGTQGCEAHEYLMNVSHKGILVVRIRTTIRKIKPYNCFF